VKYYFIWGNHC